MNTRKKIIQWAPHNPSYFAVGSTDLRIYEIKGKVRHEKNATISLIIILVVLFGKYLCAYFSDLLQLFLWLLTNYADQNENKTPLRGIQQYIDAAKGNNNINK